MLETALTATPDHGSVRLSLSVSNPTAESVMLTFRTGQCVEFTAQTHGSGSDGSTTVWRYSDDRLFTQAFITESLDPGESVAYTATWEKPPPGFYRISGELLADVDAPIVSTDVLIE